MERHSPFITRGGLAASHPRQEECSETKNPIKSFNPKPSTVGPTPMGPPNQQDIAPELTGTSAGSKQPSSERSSKTLAVEPQLTKTKTTNQPTVGHSNNRPTKVTPNPTNETKFDEMETQTNKTKKRNLTHTLSFESIFITFSLAAKTCFPTRLIKKTVYNFRDNLGPQNCNEYYALQFQMGPTIKIAKHILEKAKKSTMQCVDLIYQFSKN